MSSELAFLDIDLLAVILEPRSLTLIVSGALLAALLARLAPQIGHRLGVIDHPTRGHPANALNHKQHDHPTPAVGGIILGVAGLAIMFLNASFPSGQNTLALYQDFWLAAAVCASMFMGFLDDREHIPAVRRLGISVLIFSALTWVMPDLVLHRVPVVFLNATIDLGGWAVPFTIACIVGFQNAVNMADGKNGLVLGLAIFWLLHLQAHAPAHARPLLLGFLAISLVLFYANLRGRLFLGNAGSYGIATFFATFTLYLYGSTDRSFWHLEAPGVLLTFLLPCLDLFRVTVTRLRSGQSPFAADRNHFHHLLEESIGWRKGWFVYMALAITPAVIYHYTQTFPALTIGAGGLLYALTVWTARLKIAARG